MKIMLLNDTGNVWHVGCQGVSNAHARMLGRQGHHITHRFFNGEFAHLVDPDANSGVARVLGDALLRDAFDAVDAVVVNGEGTIHHGAGTEYLNILGAAAAVGKVTLLVNCVVEAADGFDHVFSQIDDLVVRDARSRRYLQGKGISARLVFDSFLEAGFEDMPITDMTDRVVVTDWHHQRDHDVGAKSLLFLRSQDASKHWFLPFMCRDTADAWTRIPATIRSARAMVTGRHHGIYAAVLAGIPFVALSSNTHKVEGLMDDFPELAFCLNPPSIADAVAEAVERWEMFVAIRERIVKATPLSTFEALGGAFDPLGEERELARLATDCFTRSTAFGLELAYRIRRRSMETIGG